MVIISSLNNRNYSGLSTPGHIIGSGSGLGGITGLTSNVSGTTVINNISNITSPNNEYSKETLNAKFENIKECLIASDLKMTNLYSNIDTDLQNINTNQNASDLKITNIFSNIDTDLHNINRNLNSSDLKTTNMFSNIDTDLHNIKRNLNSTDLKMTNMFSNINQDLHKINRNITASDLKISNMFARLSCELDVIRIEINMKYEEGMLPIGEEDLNIIYECFIIPYINCEIYKMGTIKQLIDLNNTLNSLIKCTTHPKTKLVLMMFKDTLGVLANARNEHMKFISHENQLVQLKIKYSKCKLLVDELEHKIKDLLDPDSKQPIGVLPGKMGITLWEPPKFAYIEAKFNLDMAWYKFLYNTDKIDLDKYNATVAYVRSFGTKEKAQEELFKLLDEKFKTFEDDLRNYNSNN